MRRSAPFLAVIVGLAATLTVLPAQAEPDAGSVAAVPALLPAEAFAAIPALSSPEVSPDGRFIATRGRRGGQEYVLFQRLFGAPGEDSAPRLLNLGPATFNWARWASDRHLVLSLRRFTRIARQEVPLDRLFAVDRDSLEVYELGPERTALSGDDVIYWAKDGSHVLLNLSRSVFDWPEVLRVDIPSNAMTRIEPKRENVVKWVANVRGEVVAGIGYTYGRALRVIYRDDPQKPFETLATIRPSGSGEGTEEIFVAHVDTAAQKGYVLSRRGGDRWGLYEYDLRARAFGPAVFAHDRVDLDDYHFDRDGRLRWVSYVEDRRKVKWLQPGDAQFFESLGKAVPDRVVQVVSASDDNRVRIVHTSAPTDPGTFYVYTEASGTMRPLARVNDRLAGAALAPMRYVTYRARDGLELSAYLTLPVGRAERRLPLVVLPHGGPFVRDEWGYDFMVQYLANRGYAVFQPNFRGSTGFGRAFNEAGFGQFGKAMQDDVNDGVAWLTGAGTVDPQRVCVVGWSYGGYVAQVASFRDPGIYRCAVSIAGISDLRAMMRYDSRFMFGDQYRKWSARITGNEPSWELNDVSALPQVQAVRVPLFLAHGTADDNVPVSQSDRLAAALRKAGKPHEYLRIEDGDHSLWDSAQRAQLLGALDRFLAAHNPTDVLRPGAAPE